MRRKSGNRQPSLFDEKPTVNPGPTLRLDLARLLEALLAEIAATLVNVKSEDGSHEQDQR
jgi:hypothetical protein